MLGNVLRMKVNITAKYTMLQYFRERKGNGFRGAPRTTIPTAISKELTSKHLNQASLGILNKSYFDINLKTRNTFFGTKILKRITLELIFNRLWPSGQERIFTFLNEKKIFRPEVSEKVQDKKRSKTRSKIGSKNTVWIQR